MYLLEQVRILYEDEGYVVVNKPAGILVHGDGKTDEPTLADWIIENYPQTKEVGEPVLMQETRNKKQETIFRHGIVHRLDRETSGVVIVAKTQQAFLHLKKQFHERNVRKVYNAFVHGVLHEDRGVINKPIGKSASDFRRKSAQPGARGELRDAMTEWRALVRGDDWTYVELRPKTGRTHQIRVHLKAIHHPVVGDTLYAPKRPPLLGFNRLALHARSITFTNLDGATVEVEAPFPDDFERAYKN